MEKTKIISFCLLLFLITSSTNAQEWEFVGLDSLLIKQLYVFGDTIYAGTVIRNGANINAGLYFSSNGGNNWVQLDSALGNAPIVDIEFYPVCKDTFYIVKGGTASSPNAKIYRTTDNGYNWLIITQLTNISIAGIEISSFNGNEIYAKESHYIPAGWFSTVYRSLDGGSNWQEITYLPSSSHGRYLSFSLSKTDSTKLYAAVNDMLGGIYFFISTDKGETWDYISEPPDIPEELITDNEITQRIYMSSLNISDDDGSTWELENSGLPDTSYYLSFYENSFSTNEIYTLRTDGIYKSSKLNILWERIDGSENLPLYQGLGGFSNLDIGQLNNIAIDNNKNDIYVGTARGIYKKELTTDIKEIINNYPFEIVLYQNFPNPFNPQTKIKYHLPINTYATLKVYDLLGNEIAILVDGEKSRGDYEIVFDGENYSSGVYIYSLITVTQRISKKMVLTK